MLYFEGRPYITLRKCDSDERGLFLSLPIAELYKFVEENETRLEMIIEGHKNIGASERVYFILNYLPGDFAFLHQGKMVRDVLLTQDCLVDLEGHKIKFGLYVTVNSQENTLDFYDAYFYTELKWYNEFSENEEIPLRPYFMGAIYGNYRGITENPDTSEFMLDIDEYSGIIKGIVNPNDCLFTHFNQVLLENSDSLKPYLSTMDQLIGNYKYEDGKVKKLSSFEDCPRWSEVVQLKQQISDLRQYDNDTNVLTVNRRIFENFEKVTVVQKEVLEKKKIREELLEEITKHQDTIQEIKYQEFLDRNKKYLETNKFKYYSSLCLLIKNENEYLKEWLDHHEEIGIDHFYIYDNGSTVPVLETIKEYKDGYYVNKTTVIEWVGTFKHMQHECYDHCLLHFGNETRWLGFIDTDEFMTTNENINELLSEFEDDFCLWIPWELYNSNGHIDNPHKPQKEAYTTAIANPFGIYGKVFLQPFRTKKMYVHLAQPKSKFDKIVNNTHIKHLDSLYDLHMQYYGDGSDRRMFERIKCNHYMTRSFEEWYEKIRRGSCDPNFLRKFATYFDYNPDLAYLLRDPKIQEMARTQQPYIA